MSCGITYAGPEDFLDEQVLAGIKRDWQAQLSYFVTDPPSVEGCLAGLKAIVGDVPAGQEWNTPMEISSVRVLHARPYLTIARTFHVTFQLAP